MPPTDPTADFQWRWRHCAFHEAGHAVAFAAHHLPTNGAHLYHRGNDPQSIHGQVDFDPHTADHDIDGLVLAGFAGPAAEAVWLARTGELGTGAARRFADQAACTGDYRLVTRYLRRSTLTRGQAYSRARHLVLTRWSAVDRVARALAHRAHLTDADIQRITR